MTAARRTARRQRRAPVGRAALEAAFELAEKTKEMVGEQAARARRASQAARRAAEALEELRALGADLACLDSERLVESLVAMAERFRADAGAREAGADPRALAGALLVAQGHSINAATAAAYGHEDEASAAIPRSHRKAVARAVEEHGQEHRQRTALRSLHDAVRELASVGHDPRG